MRTLDIGTKRFTEVQVMDEPGEGGACHEYNILSVPTTESELSTIFGHISFQNGPIKQNGVNGCYQEDLLAIVIDRLQHFQAGEFACRENALALTKIQEGLLWLQSRTADRTARGVEGTNIL